MRKRNQPRHSWRSRRRCAKCIPPRQVREDLACGLKKHDMGDKDGQHAKAGELKGRTEAGKQEEKRGEPGHLDSCREGNQGATEEQILEEDRTNPFLLLHSCSGREVTDYGVQDGRPMQNEGENPGDTGEGKRRPEKRPLPYSPRGLRRPPEV